MFDLHFTGDGLMTLLAGVIAFTAVWLQIRSSRKQVELQLASERRTRNEEQERQKRAVARAILFEIDDLYRYVLRDVRNSLQAFDPNVQELPFAKSVHPKRFHVYDTNSARLAELGEETVEGIVHFYGMMDAHLFTLRDYKAACDRTQQLVGIERSNVQAEAATLLQQIKESVPEMIKLTYLVCSLLCESADIRFEFPRVAVANEKTSIKEIVAGCAEAR